jgi:carbamoyltransferase
MKILGISPLDKDSTVCLVEDGKVLGAIAEERLSRTKMHAGFPTLALTELLQRFRLSPADIDEVVYSFLDWDHEENLMTQAIDDGLRQETPESLEGLFSLYRNFPPAPQNTFNIPGLSARNLIMEKPWHKRLAYKILSENKWLGFAYGHHQLRQWITDAAAEHRRYSMELSNGLKEFGFSCPLKRFDHHLTHAANAYFTSGFNPALIVNHINTCWPPKPSRLQRAISGVN